MPVRLQALQVLQALRRVQGLLCRRSKHCIGALLGLRVWALQVVLVLASHSLQTCCSLPLLQMLQMLQIVQMLQTLQTLNPKRPCMRG